MRRPTPSDARATATAADTPGRPAPLRRPLRVLAALAAAVGVSSGAPRAVRAERPDAAPRAVRVAWQGASPAVSFAYRDLFDPDTLRRMRSGLQVTVVMRTF